MEHGPLHYGQRGRYRHRSACAPCARYCHSQSQAGRLIDNGIVTELPDTPAVTQPLVLREKVLSTEPIRITGNAEYIDGRMIVRVSLAPTVNGKPGSEEREVMKRWRAHMDLAKSVGATITAKFFDEGEFTILEYAIPTNGLTREVGVVPGEWMQQSTEFEIPTTAQTYSMIKNWRFAWSGNWPQWSEPASTAIPAPN
jgi:hypothetical protein